MRQTGSVTLALVRLAGNTRGGGEEKLIGPSTALVVPLIISRERRRENLLQIIQTPSAANPPFCLRCGKTLSITAIFWSLPLLTCLGCFFFFLMSIVFYTCQQLFNRRPPAPPYCSTLRFLLKRTRQIERRCCHRGSRCKNNNRLAADKR